MINRRALLSVIAGVSAQAATGMRVKDAADALGIPEALSPSVPEPVELEPDTEWGWGKSNVARILDRKRDDMYVQERLPPHIADKKSWSNAYKYSVFAREQKILQVMRDKANKDRRYAQKLADVLGVPLEIYDSEWD